MMQNPIIRREARVALRNWRLFATITAYVGLLSAIIGFMLYNMVFYSYNLSFDPQEMLAIYVVLLCMQYALVIMATPALTAGSISGERERQTLDLLLVTRMSAFSIVIGKLLASLSQLLLLLVASLPVFAVVFYFGGVTLSSFLAAIGFMLLTACMAGAVSLFLSCLFKRTIISVLLVYIFFGILGIGTIIFTFFYQMLYYQTYQAEPNLWVSIIVMAFNPGVGFLSVLVEQTGVSMASVLSLGYGVLTDNQIWVLEHFYIVSMIVQIVMIGFFLWLATKFIYPVRKRKDRG